MGTEIPKFTCDMVISTFKEDLDWMNEYTKPENKFRTIYLYNKYEGNNDKSPDEMGCVLCKSDGGNAINVIKENMKNVGRCDHTYLYHIIKNWDNLADITIFTKGSSDLQREKEKLGFIIRKLFDQNNTAPRTSIFKVLKSPVNIAIQFAHFKMDTYRSTHPKNRGDSIINIYNNKMGLSHPRPFGKWYRMYFNDLPIYHVSMAGVMAVSRDIIKQHDKAYYQRFLEQLETHENPEVGHYIERSWIALFHPVPEECLYIDYGLIFGGSHKTRRQRRQRRKQRYRSHLKYRI